MTFLVTGGLGLIGHNIVARLQAYESVVVVDTKTTYGIIPQAEIDYLMAERQKKIGFLICLSRSRMSSRQFWISSSCMLSIQR